MSLHKTASMLLLAVALCGCGGQSDEVIMPTNTEPPPENGTQPFGARPYAPLTSDGPASPEK